VKNGFVEKTDTFSLRELITIPIRKKWLLIGSFLVVLMAGLLFTYTASPQYKSSSKIIISEGFAYYNNEFYSLFPNEAKNLWIFPTSTLAESMIRRLQKVSNEITGTEALKAVSGKLDISAADLKDSVSISVDTGKRFISIDVVYNNPETAYEINKSITDYYFAKTTGELDSARNTLISKIDEQITSLKKEIDELSVQAEKYVTDFNLELIAQEAKNNSGAIAFRGLDFINPSLKIEIDNRNAIYYELNLMKNNLIKNSDFFTKRLEFMTSAEISDEQVNSSHSRNAIFSVFAAIVLSLLIVYFVNYVQGFRKSNNTAGDTDKKQDQGK
jgi:capsular polysaccharide biosynthesis protein